jgi:hypothetical protein
LASSKDVAVRVSVDADIPALQAQLQFVLGDQGRPLRRAVPGQRWWRLGPLRDAELWVAKDLVARTGLVPLRDELRMARAGPFRSYVYFAASGEPTKTSLDDGSWGSTEAVLVPAEPPPRRGVNAVANKSSALTGSALLPQSSWGGQRRGTVVPAGDRVAVEPGVVPSAAGHTVRIATPSVSVSGPLGQTEANKPRRRNRGKGAGGVTAGMGSTPGDGAPPPTVPSPLEAQLAALTAQMGQMLQEIRELRKENAELRRQVEAARGLQQHQPYAAPTLPPLPPPSFSPLRSSPVPMAKTRTATELSPERGDLPLAGADGDVGMGSPAVDADLKRPRRSLAAELGSCGLAAGSYDSGLPSGHGDQC